MVFGLFAKKDPVCGMKKEEGKGIDKDGKWFCSKDCLKQYEQKSTKKEKHEGCCGGHQRN